MTDLKVVPIDPTQRGHEDIINGSPRMWAVAPTLGKAMHYCAEACNAPDVDKMGHSVGMASGRLFFAELIAKYSNNPAPYMELVEQAREVLSKLWKMVDNPHDMDRRQEVAHDAMELDKVLMKICEDMKGPNQ